MGQSESASGSHHQFLKTYKKDPQSEDSALFTSLSGRKYLFSELTFTNREECHEMLLSLGLRKKITSPFYTSLISNVFLRQIPSS